MVKSLINKGIERYYIYNVLHYYMTYIYYISHKENFFRTNLKSNYK